jgi:hypothetical protein
MSRFGTRQTSRTVAGQFLLFFTKLRVIPHKRRSEAVASYGLGWLGANLARSRVSNPDRVAANCGEVPGALLNP